ncbi:beta-glucoside-specific PTS transporter subunit IIABC [Lactococcus lactis]|uniref:beta-glucoside-specific PTS transporter subunit IIABC n=1 Tax=Lactococcus lactis TaxID=1358 RepID=UPI00241612B5|nr:beta-glucoside-specific PTS transporter subunit IIABC [Lactococcus lactis]MDG4975086.1 beta-glucoside-specific PTS transporter subunit IIABC [Lactococcus lactis]
MNLNTTASKIIELVGGKKNIAHLEHCSTRLRFTLNDDSLVRVEELEKVDGVIGVRQNVQCQVIIGNDVVEVYDEVQRQIGTLGSDKQINTNNKKKWSSVLLDFIISIFQPLVPAIAGGGILKSLLILISALGLVNTNNQTYQILNLIGGAPLYFLPILVAITTANKLKVNPIVAVSVVGALILPDLTTILASGAHFLGIGVGNVSYASQVFPAILAVLFYSQMERLFTKISPKAIRIFFVPMMSLLITVPITLIILGPLGYNIGTILSTVIVWLYSHLGWLATALLAAGLPFMVVTGMHKAMIPYAVNSMSKMGSELLYLPASLAHNISEAGACFAVALKAKDNKLKSTSISAGISASFGITEPALYGVTILNKRVLYSVMFSSLIGGGFAGFFAVKGFALVGPGIASITMFIDPKNMMNFVWALVTLGISFVISLITTLIFYKENIVVEAVKSNDKVNLELFSPVKGKTIPLSEVKDEVFSSGMVGEGIAIIPNSGELLAPIDGEISMLFATNHALGIKTASGAELLIHIGIDTVQLEGKYFESFVKQGEKVKKGQLLIQFELDKIKEAGYDTTVIFILTNKEDFSIKTHNLSNMVDNANEVLSVITNK